MATTLSAAREYALSVARGFRPLSADDDGEPDYLGIEESVRLARDALSDPVIDCSTPLARALGLLVEWDDAEHDAPPDASTDWARYDAAISAISAADAYPEPAP